MYCYMVLQVILCHMNYMVPVTLNLKDVMINIQSVSGEYFFHDAIAQLDTRP